MPVTAQRASKSIQSQRSLVHVRKALVRRSIRRLIRNIYTEPRKTKTGASQQVQYRRTSWYTHECVEPEPQSSAGHHPTCPFPPDILAQSQQPNPRLCAPYRAGQGCWRHVGPDTGSKDELTSLSQMNVTGTRMREDSSPGHSNSHCHCFCLQVSSLLIVSSPRLVSRDS